MLRSKKIREIGGFVGSDLTDGNEKCTLGAGIYKD
jgi:hypothetical protein